VQSTLNSLQDRVLGVVATVGGWTLTGGGALAGVHLGHRTLYGARSFDREPRAVEDALVDARALVAIGVDLDRAIRDVSRKDGGFSPMTLAWVIGQLDLSRAKALGFDRVALAEFRDELLRRLAAEG
jgi:hypothetical protein